MDTLATPNDVVAAHGLSIASSFSQAWQDDPKAIWSSFSMIIVSEIGDKTFLIAAILAMRQSRSIVFAGAFGALALMSILSAFMGVVLPTLLPRSVTTLMAAILFFVFGVKMLRDGMQMTGEEMGEEWEEAKREVEEEANADDRFEMNDLEEGNHLPSNGNGHPGRRESMSKSRSPNASTFSVEGLKDGTRNLCGLCFSPVFAHAFILTFLGEWGDRSQIATIALAAAHNIALVSFGTIAGHAICTGMAVMGGRWIATRISVKHVTLGGALMFIIFGLLYTFESITEARQVSASATTVTEKIIAAVTPSVFDSKAAPFPPHLDVPPMGGMGIARS